MDNRLDVNKIIELEDKVDILEGKEASNPLPILKSELDSLNDRLLVLEDKETTGPQNPMFISDILNFESRIKTQENKNNTPKHHTPVYVDKIENVSSDDVCYRVYLHCDVDGCTEHDDIFKEDVAHNYQHSTETIFDTTIEFDECTHCHKVINEVETINN